MRQKKESILEYDLKKSMFELSLDVIYPEVIKRSKSINIKSPMFVAVGDLITQIKKFKETNEIIYPLGFFFCMIMGEAYNKIVSNEDLLLSTITSMKNEKNWDERNISYEVSVYFSYTFMQELYKDIAIDTYLIFNSSDVVASFKKLREEII